MISADFRNKYELSRDKGLTASSYMVYNYTESKKYRLQRRSYENE